MPANKNNIGFKRFIKFWIPVLLWMGVIFYFSCLPGKDIPSLFPFQDVLFHIIVYTALACLFYRALKNTYTQLGLLKLIFFTVAFGFIYGLSDEFHQSFVPGRSACAFDLFIDTIGSFMGSLIYR
jgi:VanZ family protein